MKCVHCKVSYGKRNTDGIGGDLCEKCLQELKESNDYKEYMELENTRKYLRTIQSGSPAGEGSKFGTSYR